MKTIAFLLLALTTCFCARVQVFVTQRSSILFFSDAPLEDIKAENKKVESAIDLSSGIIEFRVSMKEFEFDKSLMRQHFNEKYVHTSKYPHAFFRGNVEGLSVQSGQRQVKAVGKLTLHGVTRDVAVAGTLDVQPGSLRIRAKFLLRLEDYEVPRPQLLWQNIAEEVEVTLDLTYKPQ
ncbi:MAG TPA: YceI family protein [Cytophagales bacterium]|nr:YceI family protein [Cytophagales bacterium]